MIRALLMIAVAGFFLSLVTISTAVAIGGPDVVARGAWSSWNWDWDDDRHDWSHDGGEWDGDKGPQATREIPWTAGDTLELNVLADVTYRQADGPAKLVVTGRKRAVDLVRVDDDGEVRLDGHRSRSRLHILMTAPNVRTFKLNGSDRLVVEGYDHDVLNLELSGASEAVVEGKARVVDLDISGSGEADLEKLAVRDADVEISGSGEATIAPSDSADLEISGSGEITLATRPPRLNSDVSGSGSIRQLDEGDRIAPTPPTAPTPPSSPTPRASKT